MASRYPTISEGKVVHCERETMAGGIWRIVYGIKPIKSGGTLSDSPGHDGMYRHKQHLLPRV